MSGLVMSLKIRDYVVIVRTFVSSNRQQERRFLVEYQRKYLSKLVPKETRSYIGKKTKEFIMWYDEFTGMDQVREAHKMVVQDEENFRKAQAVRREFLSQLTDIQRKLKDLYFELENTNRGDDRYVVLVTQEHKLLKEEKYILEQFNRAEKAEREAFSALSSSVKMSHEKERSQNERTKYWSIIGSILGTVIGVLGSSINNHFKMNELKELIKNSSSVHLMECLDRYLGVNEQIMEMFKAQASVNTINEEKHGSNLVKLGETLKETNRKLMEVEESLKKIEKVTKERIESSTDETDPDSLKISVKKDYSQIKLLLFSLSVLSILMPIITRYS